MYFCERCNRLVEHGRCSLCGIRKLRKVKDTDFCYLTTVSDSGKNYFEETLKANAIPVTMFGEGLVSGRSEVRNSKYTFLTDITIRLRKFIISYSETGNEKHEFCKMFPKQSGRAENPRFFCCF